MGVGGIAIGEGVMPVHLSRTSSMCIPNKPSCKAKESKRLIKEKDSWFRQSPKKKKKGFFFSFFFLVVVMVVP